MVHRENRRQRFTFGEVHQGGVGEIHGAIPVPRHQRVHVPQFGILDGGDDDCARKRELPGSLHLRSAIANKMEQLRQNGFRGQQGKAKAAKGIDAELVPAIGAVQQRENRAGINERVGHGAGGGGGRELRHAPSLRVGGCGL